MDKIKLPKPSETLPLWFVIPLVIALIAWRVCRFFGWEQ